jgi:hypothetical protein
MQWDPVWRLYRPLRGLFPVTIAEGPRHSHWRGVGGIINAHGTPGHTDCCGMSSTIIVLYLVWVEQYMALTQKEMLPSTSCHNGSRKRRFWITYRLRTISCSIGTRVVIRPEGCFLTRILTVELQRDESWGKTGHMGSKCPMTYQDVNSSNGFRPKQGFNSGCNVGRNTREEAMPVVTRSPVASAN